MFAGPNNSIKTRHYVVRNLSEFKEHEDKLKRYIDDIEEIFPIIEEVFGRKWDFGVINIFLKEFGSPNYDYKKEEGGHKIELPIDNRSLQEREFPENLWGGLFHETLHAFMHHIVHRDGECNYLDGDTGKEVFTFSFQRLVYLKLKEKEKLPEELCRSFLQRLEREIGEGRELYETYYREIFSKRESFARLIEILDLKPEPFFKSKENFPQDFIKARKMLFPHEFEG